MTAARQVQEPNAAAASMTKSFQGLSDIKLVFRQLRFEQLSFWPNPIGAVFTIGFSTIFLVFSSLPGTPRSGMASTSSTCSTTYPDSLPTASCRPATTSWPSAWSTAGRWGSQTGAAQPVPTWILMAAIFLSSMIIALLRW